MKDLMLISDFLTEHEVLKPCPFCGATPTHVRLTQGTKWGNVVCCCEGPEARTDYGKPAEWVPDAIKEWNRRTPHESEGK